jgi:predicted 3-demethylubiquinone-9 3-methyltransferase (glyoxalase superfamily)
MTTIKSKIIPHLWYDKEAKEAAAFYCALFPASKITNVTTLHDTPSGDCDIVSFELAGQPFMAISAGPLFKFNPSVSFFLNFDPSKDKDARKNLDTTWEKLSEGLPAPQPNTFYVYAIKCDDGSLYIGQTDDLKQRWQEHVAGRGAEWTKKHKPQYIAHHEIYPTRDEAVKREKKLKTGFGRKWLKREIEAGRARQAGGTPLMPLDKYPFSERYGWIQDKYGLSWQLILTNPEGEERPFIVPSLLFVGDVCGKAEAASDFYLSVFNNTKRGLIARYPKGAEPDKEGTIMFTDFMLENQWFAAMDSAHEHKFAFNEAISFLVSCDNQKEIDDYWEKLSAVPNAEVCGWLKDKYGLSWQVHPAALDEMLQRGTKEQIARVTQAFLQMKKFDLAELQKAYDEQ